MSEIVEKKPEQQWRPAARFQIPSELQNLAYRQFLEDLLKEFFTVVDKRNKPQWPPFSLGYYSGDEGGIGQAYLGEELYLLDCKLFYYDGDVIKNGLDWQGLMFMNHFDQLGRVPVITGLAVLFCDFLVKKGIPHECFARNAENVDVPKSKFVG